MEDLLSQGRNDRAVLSVLAFCYFTVSDFQSAAACYEQLVLICPTVVDYGYHLAQSLFKGGRLDEAMAACCKVENSHLKPKVIELKAAILYEKNDFTKSLETLASLNTADYQTLINEGCVYFKQE